MSLWDTIRGWTVRDAKKLVYLPIPDNHTDVSPAVKEIVARKHYFRLWLAEMHLKRDREWFKSWYPVAHTLVRFQFGEQQLEVANVAGPLKLNGVTANNLEEVVKLNYPMTTLMPFRGGVVEIMAGLFAMKGKDFLQSFLSVMEDFSSLLVVPQLSAALKVAGPVATGVEKLLGATDGQLHIGLHQAFVGQGGGGNVLKPGYYAVIRAEEHEINRDHFWIVDDRLRYGPESGKSEPFTKYPHMVFRIEGQDTRDDWDSLTTIAEPRMRMLEALVQGRQDEATALLQASKIALFLSPDLTDAHKRVVSKVLDDEFESFSSTGVAEGRMLPSLSWAMKSAPSIDTISSDHLDVEELYSTRAP